MVYYTIYHIALATSQKKKKKAQDQKNIDKILATWSSMQVKYFLCERQSETCDDRESEKEKRMDMPQCLQRKIPV